MKRKFCFASVGSALLFAFACQNQIAPDNAVSYGGSAGSGAAPAGAGGGAGAGGSGVGALGGIGGAGINFDSGSASDANLDAACQAISQGVQVETVPVDIIWGIDTSGSMRDETTAVQANINAFSQQITAANIDVHVVMLAEYPVCPPPLIPGLPPPRCEPGVCVGAPLGSGQCPNDSVSPFFYHHPSAAVDSHDGAAVFINRFPEYKSSLRVNSLKYLVIVTDDDSTGGQAGAYADNPDQFITDYTALDPMMRDANGAQVWKMSGIYAHKGENDGCPNAAAVGVFWKAVIDKTGGVHGDICACPDGQQAACTQTFKTVFDALAKTIVTAAKPLDCEYAIPPPPPGKEFDKLRVNVNLNSDGKSEDIFYVPDATKCDPVLGGWYYDNEAAPTKILTCPKSCEKIKATLNGSIAVAFGCARKDIPTAQ